MYIHVYGGVFVKIERNWDTSPLVLLDTIHGQQHILHDGKERVRCKRPPNTRAKTFHTYVHHPSAARYQLKDVLHSG